MNQQVQLLAQMGIGPLWKLTKLKEALPHQEYEASVCPQCGRNQEDISHQFSGQFTEKTCLFVVPDATLSVVAQKLMENMLVVVQKNMPAYKIQLFSSETTHAHESLCAACLKRLMASMPPAMLLVFGVACASELLELKEVPNLEQLRQKVHDFSGVPMVVSYSLDYLLRQPKMKCRAWEDLCLAMKTIG